MPGLVDVLGFIRPHLDTPGVGAHAGYVFVVEPVATLELETRGVAARVSPPLAAPVAGFHLPGAHNHEIPPANLDPLCRRAGVKVVVGDALAILETVDALEAGDVEQHATTDQLVAGVLNPELGSSVAVDRGGVMAVVHLVVIENMP